MVTCGGLHVLLTFFPRDVQEEVQIMGRGARQGEDGSFSLVLLRDQLDDFAGDKAAPGDLNAWTSNNELYEQMSAIRQEQAANDMEERLANAEKAKETHDEVASAFNTFGKRGDSKQLSLLLKKYNHVAASTTSRTLMLIDITYSMNPLIEKLKANIGEFFQRVQLVLDAQQIESGFEIAIAGYSNYNVPVEQILEASTWEQKPHNLGRFLKDLDTRGGWGEEAIEVGLMHALSEHQKRPLDQIILIGDAAPNSQSEIERKRKVNFAQGDFYWDSQAPSWSPSGIAKKQAGLVLHEIQLAKPVPIHCYYMQSRARNGFEELAAATGGGTAQHLDVNSQSGATLLTDAVCKQILSSLGGKALADAYERMKPSFSR